MNHSANPEINSIADVFVEHSLEYTTIPDGSFWIPFQSQSEKNQFEIQTALFVNHHDFTTLEFNVIPSIFNLKLNLVKTLLHADGPNSMKLLSNLWRDRNPSTKNLSILKVAELLYLIRNVLKDHYDRDEVSMAALGLRYYQASAKIDVIAGLIISEGSKLPNRLYDLPKWKGKSMQFIELISIGIELDLFEGQNQNQICNSLLKAFQVDAESEQPIYKQRFNALFKRSKVHLPLIADFINKVEESKKMKIVLESDKNSVRASSGLMGRSLA